MSLGRLKSTGGQSLAEYAIIVAAIAVGCAMVVLFVSGGVGGLFNTSSKPIKGGSLEPPAHGGTPFGGPQTVGDCENGGWVIYNYPSLEACKEAVLGGN
jgi:Flp pilus assembly pilin Flp